MKRTIKFRFWNPDKFMMEDHKGWREDIGINEAIEASQNYGYATMQFTGLKDKNGVEIIEGSCFKDVLNSDLIGVVKFGEYVNCFDEDRLTRLGGHCGFYVEFKKGYIRNDLKYWAKNSEIIGNIYENPELL